MDNSEIILRYADTDDGYELLYDAGDVDPDDFASDDRYLVLSEDFLPERLSWNVNTYRESIVNSIEAAVKNAVDSGDYAAFRCGNFPAFTEEGAAEMSDQLLEQVAEDAANVLIYRVTAAEVNRDSTFALQVERQFANYCSHLLAPEEGLDAVFKSFYLTHAFEYEIAEELRLFCDRMALKTGTYGAFTANVLGMSDSVTEREKKNALDTYCGALITIGQAKDNGLTGRDQYCYLTNTALRLDEVYFETKMEVNTRIRGMASAYQEYTAHPISVEYGGRLKDGEYLIGDTGALLLTYMLQSNGADPDFAYLNEHLGRKYLSDYGSIITSMSGEKILPLDNTAKMQVYCVLGSYFPNGSKIGMDQLPEDADTDYVQYRRMISGTTMNPDGSMEVNRMLTGTAFYGESHLYWETDEVASLGGPVNYRTFSASIDKERVDVDFWGQVYYVSHYGQGIAYNCLLAEPIKSELRGRRGYDPIAAYEELCEEWNGGSERAVTFSGGRTTYAVDLPAAAEHGTVTAEPKRAAAGTEITLTVTPEKGYTLETLTVTDAGGNELELMKTGDDTFCFRMPSRAVRVSATFMEDNTMLNYFVDVFASDWYYDGVLWAAENGIAQGSDGLRFLPYAPCTRAQAVALLWRAAGRPAADGKNPFGDLAESAYYEEAVDWASSCGVTKGTTAATFSPDREITREALAAMIFHAAKQKDVAPLDSASALASFADASAVSPWAEEAMAWCVAQGIVNGTADGRLDPQGTVSRAACVMLLYRAFAR